MSFMPLAGANNAKTDITRALSHMHAHKRATNENALAQSTRLTGDIRHTLDLIVSLGTYQ